MSRGKKTNDTRLLILVIDDDSSNQDLLKRRLGRLNYEVVGVAHAEEAIPVVEARREELLAVFLDLRLSGGMEAGLNLLDEIKSIDPLIPVIAYSAYEQERALKAVERGASWYIDKVLGQEEEFATAITSVLRTWKLVGRMLDAETHRDFFQRLINSIPYEIMVRDRDGFIHYENSAKTEKFGDDFVPGQILCKHRYEDKCSGKPCACEEAFDDGEVHSRYYTWEGRTLTDCAIEGAELHLIAAPAGRTPTGIDVVVETAEDVSRQVGFQELMQKLSRLSREGRDVVMETVVKHLTDRQEPLKRRNGVVSKAKIGFTRARFYRVMPRCGDEKLVLQSCVGEHAPGFRKESVVFHRRKSPKISELWEHPDEVRLIHLKDLVGNVEEEPFCLIGEVRERVWIPIRVGDHLEAVIVADKLGKAQRNGGDSESIEWEELHWCQVLSEHLSGVFETIYHLESLQWLLETEQAMAKSHTVERIYESLLAPTKKYFEADMVGVHVRDADGSLRLVASIGHSPSCRIGAKGYSTRIGINARGCRENEPQFIENCWEDEDFNLCQQQNVGCSVDCPLRTKVGDPYSMAVIPFGGGENPIGTLCLAFKSRRTFDSIDRDFLKGLGAGLSVAFAAVRAEEKAREREMWKTLTCRAVHRLANVLQLAKTPMDLYLRYGEGDPKAAMTEAKEEIGQTLAIVSAMKDFSKFETVHPNVRLTVGELAGSLCSDLRKHFHVNGIKFFIDRPAKADEFVVHVDYQRLREEFVGLTGNARKYSGLSDADLKIRIGVGGKVEERDGNAYTCIFFADNGKGIEPKNKSQLFKPFCSTGSTSMGLGLYILKEAIEGHGGWIEPAETEVGARFDIWLPIKPKGEN